jgi:predicted molibdopterin-dependent oxidoreductase YjgC
MKNNSPKQTEYCPTCGAPVTYSGIGCDYIPETVNTELLEALQSAREQLRTAQCIIQGKFDKDLIQAEIDRIDQAINKAIN